MVDDGLDAPTVTMDAAELEQPTVVMEAEEPAKEEKSIKGEQEKTPRGTRKEKIQPDCISLEEQSCSWRLELSLSKQLVLTFQVSVKKHPHKHLRSRYTKR